MKKILAVLLLLNMFTNNAEAQNTVTNVLRGNGNFNSVIVVVGIIFCGIVFFLFRMDRRLSKLEKQKENRS